MGWFKIGDLFTLQMGKTPARSNSSFWGNGHIWVSISDLSNCNKYIASSRELITDDAVQESGIRIVPQGTLIMSFKLSLGKTAITASNLYTNEAIMAFIDKKIVPLDINYVYHLFNNWDWSRATNKAVMGLTLNKATLSQIKIPIPSLNTQKAIANILDKIDESITLRKRQLEIFNQLVKSRFLERFGDPIINPFDYPIHELGDYIENLTSGSRGWARYYADDGNAWFITIKNVKNCKITVDNMQTINAPDNAEAKRTRVKEGDLLISITADLGRTGVVTKEIANKGSYINQHLSCIRLNRHALEPLYVAYFMESEAGKRQFKKENQSAVKAGINFKSIQSLKLMVPPLVRQEEFLSFYKQVDKSKMAVQKSLDELETLKKSLMQTYFG